MSGEREHMIKVVNEAEELLKTKSSIKQCQTRDSGLPGNRYLIAGTVKEESSLHKEGSEWILIDFDINTLKVVFRYENNGIAGLPDEKTVYNDPLDLTAQDIKKFADNNIQ